MSLSSRLTHVASSHAHNARSHPVVSRLITGGMSLADYKLFLVKLFPVVHALNQLPVELRDRVPANAPYAGVLCDRLRQSVRHESRDHEYVQRDATRLGVDVVPNGALMHAMRYITEGSPLRWAAMAFLVTVSSAEVLPVAYRHMRAAEAVEPMYLTWLEFHARKAVPAAAGWHTAVKKLDELLVDHPQEVQSAVFAANELSAFLDSYHRTSAAAPSIPQGLRISL